MRFSLEIEHCLCDLICNKQKFSEQKKQPNEHEFNLRKMK